MVVHLVGAVADVLPAAFVDAADIFAQAVDSVVWREGKGEGGGGVGGEGEAEGAGEGVW